MIIFRNFATAFCSGESNLSTAKYSGESKFPLYFAAVNHDSAGRQIVPTASRISQSGDLTLCITAENNRESNIAEA
jgi:hypothetical protein